MKHKQRLQESFDLIKVVYEFSNKIFNLINVDNVIEVLEEEDIIGEDVDDIEMILTIIQLILNNPVQVVLLMKIKQ